MLKTDAKKHWETIYENNTPDQVSWTQDKPEVSLQMIKDAGVPNTASIIDVGGGDSKLVDYLLDEGYSNITVLDISAKALEKTKKRLGNKADIIHFVVSDILNFKPYTAYDLWHDRAAFHFLTSEKDIENYKTLVEKFVNESLIIGTFSKEGPTKCSGLNITQYDEQELNTVFENHFETEDCLTIDHKTPFNTLQNFQFCSFRKLK